MMICFVVDTRVDEFGNVWDTYWLGESKLGVILTYKDGTVSVILWEGLQLDSPSYREAIMSLVNNDDAVHPDIN